MSSLIKSEFYKLKKDKSYLLLLILTYIIGSILLLDYEKLNGYKTLFYSLYNAPILMIITSVFGALYLGKDFADRTIDLLICAGHRRRQIFFVKALFFILGSNLILLLQPILSTILNTLLNGWGHTSNPNEVIYLLKLFFVTSILNGAMCGITLIAAFLFKDIGKTLSIPAFIYFAMVFLLNSKKAIKIAYVIPLGQLRLILEKISSFKAAFLVGFLYLILFLIIADCIFEKSELK